MSDTLIDSSAWIDFFRGERAAVLRIDALLADSRAGVAGPIYAEVLSGVAGRAAYQRLKLLLRALDWLEPPPEVWEKVAEARFTLARQGIQAHLVDLHIAVTSMHAGHRLLTRDEDFVRIAKVLPIEVDCF